MTRRMLTTTWVALSLLGLAGTTLTAPSARAADEMEWTSLFDGKTLSGWEMVQLGKQESKWEVVDGVLQGSGSQSMLYSPKSDYKNFKFRVELKINDHGNSGMYVRSAKTPSFTDGHEIQVNSTHTDPIRTGSLYTLVHLFKTTVPPDTYFTQEVEVADINYRGKVVTRFRISVNGELLYEFLDYERKFKTGHLGFQQHDPGSKVSIRKVEVMELPEKTK